MKETRILYMAVLLAVLLAVPSVLHAQLYNPEIEAYIALHKKTGPAFTARTTVEHANSDLHKKTAKGAQMYRETGDSLGMYYKAFNWIDIAYTSLKFGFNVYNTVDVARRRISAIISLLDDYQKEVLKHGNIEKDDQVIIDIGQQLYGSVSGDVNAILYSAGIILGFSAVKIPCTTYSLLENLHIINEALEHIQSSLNIAWGRLYMFMLARLGWRWNFSYTPLDRVSVTEGAIGRWRAATMESLNRTASSHINE